MVRRYIPNGMGRALLAIVKPSLSAPAKQEAPYQNSPHQAVGTLPQFPQTTDFSQASPVLELFAQLNQWEVIKMIPVYQPANIIRAPHSPMGAKTLGVVDQRLMSDYPGTAAKDSYAYGHMTAPARLQSVPGYIVKQTTTTRKSVGYPTQALRAPKMKTGGGGCDD